ncbi:MAG: prolyl oligopeptidase family serine peptidase, partial [Phycisphaerae bacterium]
MRRLVLLTLIATLCITAGAGADEPNAVAWKINETPAELRLVGPRYLFEKDAEFTVEIPTDRRPLTCRIRVEKNGGGFRKTVPVQAVSDRHSPQKRKNGKVYAVPIPVGTALWPDGEYTAVLEYVSGNPPVPDENRQVTYEDGPTADFRVVRRWVKENVPAAIRPEFAVWLEHVNRPRDVWKKVPYWRNVDRIFEDPTLLYGRLRGLVLRSYPNPQLGRLQPYTVYVPKSYDANEPWPLMILLHGSGGDYRNIISDLYEGQELETNPMLIANAGAFTRQEYRHLALEDVMGVLADMRSKYNVDANRVYVQGISLGGRGSIELAALRPHVFAAACPQGVYGMFQQAADPAGMAAMDPYARWQLARWDLRSYLPNVRTVPMQIVLGRKDTTTPPHNALVFRHLLRYYLGGQAEIAAFDAGHNISYP